MQKLLTQHNRHIVSVEIFEIIEFFTFNDSVKWKWTELQQDDETIEAIIELGSTNKS